MLEILPVLHVGGTREYSKYPGQVSPVSKDFLVPRTKSVLINVTSNRDNFDRTQNSSGRTIFCDSGGLQLGTVGWERDSPSPRQVMQYQNQTSDIGFVLDDLSPFRRFGDERIELPVLASRIAEAGLGPLFQKCAENTRRNIDEMMRFREGRIKLYCILQGFSTEQIAYFHKVVTKDHDLDGFGMKAIAPRSTIEALAFIKEHLDNKPIHILGNGRIGKTYPLVLFGARFKPKFTADSTSCHAGTMYRRFYSPLGDISYQTPTINGTVTATGPPLFACSCRVCDWGNELIEAGKLSQLDYLFGHIITAHNWGRMMDDHAYLTALAQKPDLFREHAETFERYGEEMGEVMSDRITAVDMVDAITMICDGEGQKAVERYCRRVMTSEAFF